MLRRFALALSLVATSAAAGSAQQLTSLATDAAYQSLIADGGFTRLVGAEARWGNDGTDGPWEQALVDGAGDALFTKQLSWSALQSESGSHAFAFSLGRDGGWYAEYYLPGVGMYGQSAWGEVTPQVGFAPFNALVIGASAAAGGGMTFTSPLTLRFRMTDEEITIDPFAADADGGYVMVVDERLAWGFQLTGTATFEGASTGGMAAMSALDGGPSYRFDVGLAATSAVPEPSSYALMATGLVGLGLAARRRRSAR